MTAGVTPDPINQGKDAPGKPENGALATKTMIDYNETPHPDPDTERPEDDPKPEKQRPQHYVLPPRCADMIEAYRCTGEETDMLGSYTGNVSPLLTGTPDLLFPKAPNPLIGIPGKHFEFPAQDADDL